MLIIPKIHTMIKELTASLAVMAIAFNAGAIKILSGPYLQNVSANEATIMWRTDKNSTGWVEIAPDDRTNFYACERPRTYATDLGRAVIGTMHEVKLTGLQPGTTYRYRIFSEEVSDQTPYHVTYGEIASTDVFHKQPLQFTTTDPDKPNLHFRVLNDIHGDNALLTDLLGDFDKSSTDFIFYNGDMVSFMDNENQLFEGFVDRSAELFASETPLYMARGNHETRGNLAKDYMTYFPTPTGMPYYSFRYGPLYIIVLDGGEDKPDSDIEYSRTSFFDDYRRDEARWLKEVTASEDFRNAPFKMVITHIPPVNDSWHGPLHAKELFLPILNEAGIDLMLCGHLHCHQYHKAGTDGAMFPILVNSNKEALDVTADGNRLKVDVINREGTRLKTLTYARK